MKHSIVFAILLVLAGSVVTSPGEVQAGPQIPAGTVLPVRLNSSLSSKKTKLGQIVTARIMQDVPLPRQTKIRAGAVVIGHVVSVTPAANGNAAISIRFDKLKVRNEMFPITTHLRAIASFTEVEQAQVPITGPDRGTPETAWTTVQIGGDAVYRGGGAVEGEFGEVGRPVSNGVLGYVSPNPEAGCPGASDKNGAPQALWVFSASACGAYSLPNLKIAHAGRTEPRGEITLESRKGEVNVASGGGLLLRVDSPTNLNGGKQGR